MKAQALLVYFMIGILFFILGMALAYPLNSVMSENMNNNQLNCTNSTMSNQDKGVCRTLDVIPPVFVGVIFGLGGMLIVRVLV